MTTRVIAIVQARMGSSRLPGKVLMDLAGEPMLGRVVERARRARLLDDVVLATTTESSDDAIDTYCRSKGIPCSRGSHFDVLDRFHSTAREAKADIVVRITADCPLVDPTLLDDAVRVLIGSGRELSTGVSETSTTFDFVANRLPPPWKRTYPIGLDVEVCAFAALEHAWREAVQPKDREHVMPFLYEGVRLVLLRPLLLTGTSPQGFRIAVIDHSEDLGYHRWTVDTSEDLEFLRQVYAHFGARADFSWLEVLELLHRRPELASINASIRHKSLRDTDERAAGARLE